MNAIYQKKLWDSKALGRCAKKQNIYLEQWLANVNVRRGLFLSTNKEVNVCDGQVRARRLIQLGNRLRIVQYLQFSTDSGPIN